MLWTSIHVLMLIAGGSDNEDVDQPTERSFWGPMLDLYKCPDTEHRTHTLQSLLQRAHHL